MQTPQIILSLSAKLIADLFAGGNPPPAFAVAPANIPPAERMKVAA